MKVRTDTTEPIEKGSIIWLEGDQSWVLVEGVADSNGSVKGTWLISIPLDTPIEVATDIILDAITEAPELTEAFDCLVKHYNS